MKGRDCIRLEEVRKEYQLGGTVVPALRNVSLEIETGEFIAVWGPSGSGKTTLLNLIGLIDEPTRGRIFLRGKNVAFLSDDEKSGIRNEHIGFIFQNFNLVPVLSALENVMLPLQIYAKEAAKEIVRKAVGRLEQVGLADFIHHRPDTLSGGQQQRVSIARALIARPLLVIADEPTANLDSGTALQTIKMMRTLSEREGTTFIFSTHDQRLLDNVRRLIRIEDGLVVSDERRL